MKPYISVSFVLLLFFLFTSSTFAQTVSPKVSPVQKSTPTPTPLVIKGEAPKVGVNLTVSPVFVSLKSDPGRKVESSIRVRNNNAIREYLQVSVAKFASGPTGKPVLADLSDKDEFGKWISIPEKEFTLDSNESKTVKFVIDVPKDAALGYYYALKVSRIQERGAEGREAVVSGSPAVPVLLEVKSENAKREIQVLDFTTDAPVYEYLPTEFRVRIKNTGNIHVVPFGDVRIDWGGKKQIAIVPINEGRGNVLPQTERVFPVTWDDAMIVRVPKKDASGKEVKDAKGNAVMTTKWDLSKADRFRIGKYTANMLLAYDNGERDVLLDATVSFWVIPWKIIIGTVVVAILALFGLKNMLISNIRKIKKLFSHGN